MDDEDDDGQALGLTMWILTSDERLGQLVFRVVPGAIKTVGRAPRADFVIDAALVSRLHCRLEADSDHLQVIDLSSTNGTFVNDARIDRAHLQSGDRLRVGRVELRVEKAGSQARRTARIGR